MLICLVTFILILIHLKDTEATLLEPERQCVPTATVRGPCYVCVCSSEGVFHCSQQECERDNLERVSRQGRASEECERHYVYRDHNIFCTCDNDGYWKSGNCEEKYSYLQPRFALTHPILRTNIVCIPNILYLIDCNVCQCSTSGFIDIKLCTNRYCSKGHKADSCVYGDVLRLDNEVCSCSDINYYIDRLCISILKQVVQKLQRNDIIKLIDIGRSWRRLQDLETDICFNSETIYTVDCNQCVCARGQLVCTEKVCKREKKTALRNVRAEVKNESEAFPVLRSDADLCDPGKKYRFKCNTCWCSSYGVPSCTTMVCLEDYLLDIKALRGALSNI